MKNLTFKTKLLFIGVVPLIGLILFNLHFLGDKGGEFLLARNLKSLTEVQFSINNLIHKFKKERGASALYINSQGKEFGERLKAQREETNKRLEEFNKTIKDLKDSEIGEVLNPVLNLLKELDGFRRKIDALEIPGPESFRFYTELITNLFRVKPEIVKKAEHPELKELFTKLYLFSSAKELAGQERATGSGILAKGSISQEAYTRFIFLKGTQEDLLARYLILANSEEKSYYEEKMRAQREVVEEIEKIRTSIIERGVGASVSDLSAPRWFELTTKRIDTLREVERDLVSEIKKVLKKLYYGNLIFLIVGLGIMFLGGSLTLFLGRVMVRNILRDVGGEPKEVKEILKKMAKGDFTGRMEGGIKEVGSILFNASVLKGILGNLFSVLLP